MKFRIVKKPLKFPFMQIHHGMHFKREFRSNIYVMSCVADDTP